MPELCSKFQISVTNTEGADAETRTVLQCDVVQNMYVIQGDINIDLNQNFVSFISAHVQCMSELCCKFQILYQKCRRSCGDKNSSKTCDVHTCGQG